VGIDGDNWVERDLAARVASVHADEGPRVGADDPAASGSGVWLEDFAGKRYVDGISSWWVNLFGHANPRINAAVREQLERWSTPSSRASRTTARSRWRRSWRASRRRLKRCFFADNGSAPSKSRSR
jgi:adenosylmethionine-8-amino-7-oxononanoate aminotransferase